MHGCGAPYALSILLAAVQAYRLLRAAAGIFDFVRDHCATFLINAVDTKDCNCQVGPSAEPAALAGARSLGGLALAYRF